MHILEKCVFSPNDWIFWKRTNGNSEKFAKKRQMDPS